MSQIPEGATHTYKGIGGGYRRLNSDWTWDKWDDVGHWVAVSVPRPDLYQPIAAEAWNGEGLPPVGTVCEVVGLGTGTLPRSLETWIDGDKVECIAHVAMQGADHVSAVFFNKRAFGFASLRGDCFRPIRTSKQIAAEERDVEINLMASKCPNPGCDIVRAICSAIYDAGYRKFEIVEEDDNA